VKNISLKTRMAVSVSLLFVIFSVLITSFSISYMEDKFKQSLANQQKTLAHALADNIDDKLMVLQKALDVTSHDLPVAGIADPDKIQRYLDERVTLHSLFNTRIFLLSADGAIIAESPFTPNRRGVNLAYREYFLKTVATGKSVISSPYISSLPHHQPVVMLTAPIFDQQGKLVCVLCGGLLLMDKNLLSDLPQIKIGATGYVSLTTSDRTMIVHPDRSRIMKKTPPPGVNKLYDKAVAGIDCTGETVNSTGIPVLASYKHLSVANSNWIVGLHLPLSEAYAPVVKTRQYLLGGIVAGTLAMLSIAWLVMRRLTKPLEIVTRQMEAMVREPGAPRRLSYSATDEIDTLATAFNGMVAVLDKKQAALLESENNFRSLAETASDGMLVITDSGSFIYCNYHAARILGYGVEELLRCGIDDLAHPDELSCLRERFNKIISWQKVPRQYETRLLCKDGAAIPVEVTSSLTIWREQSADLVIFRDISERRRIEKALLDSYTLLQQTFASLNEAVFIVRTGTRIIQDCNITVEKMFGYSREEMIGVTTACLHLSAETSDWFGKEMLKDYDEKGHFETVFKMKRKDGTVFDSEHLVSPIRDNEGIISSHVCVVRDISERIRAEQELRESEARFRAIYEGARDAVIMADIESGLILDVNTQAEKLLGRPKCEIIRMHQTELHPPENLEYSRETFKEHVRSSGAVPLCNEIITAAGDRVPVEINASVIQLADGRNVILGIFRDITERKRAEEEINSLNMNLRQQAVELAAANRELESFGYTLSHDLKAPLTTIFCAAQGLLDVCGEQLDETGKFFLDGICKGSERMDELIDAMFLFSNISRSELRLEEIDLSLLVTQIMLGLRMEDQNRHVESVIEPGIKATVDTPLMKSALENLLGNAWKYSRNEPVARIEFGRFSHEREQVYFVRDNGAGFDMKSADRLFIPFQRLHQACEFEGTGIGLATVQRIIERHGGKLWGEGEPGRGAAFYFTLPDSTISSPKADGC
jgi:PAS domain S-box-containing protein